MLRPIIKATEQTCAGHVPLNLVPQPDLGRTPCASLTRTEHWPMGQTALSNGSLQGASPALDSVHGA